jgi:glucokinase
VSAAPAAIGLDVGGQSVKAVLVSAGGEVLAKATAPTGEDTDSAGLVATLGTLRDSLAAASGVAKGAVLPAGVGLAGALDREGIVRGSPHLPLLVGTRLGERLEKRFGVACSVHNDADCAAMAEGWHGAADGCADFLLVAIGTGVGSGLVLDGRLRSGVDRHGCELGHMMVVHRGRRCGCGNLGCLEAYVSESAARGLAAEASPALRALVEARRVSKGGGCAEALFGLAAEGDAEAEAIAEGMVDVLGAAIGSVVNVLDLTTVVIGGGIAPGILARIDGLRRAAASTLFARQGHDLAILAASRGALAGAIGAARLGLLAR